jgi:hypothetical protein
MDYDDSNSETLPFSNPKKNDLPSSDILIHVIIPSNLI